MKGEHNPAAQEQATTTVNARSNVNKYGIAEKFTYEVSIEQLLQMRSKP